MIQKCWQSSPCPWSKLVSLLVVVSGHPEIRKRGRFQLLLWKVDRNEHRQPHQVPMGMKVSSKGNDSKIVDSTLVPECILGILRVNWSSRIMKVRAQQTRGTIKEQNWENLLILVRMENKDDHAQIFQWSEHGIQIQISWLSKDPNLGLSRLTGFTVLYSLSASLVRLSAKLSIRKQIQSEMVAI